MNLYSNSNAEVINVNDNGNLSSNNVNNGSGGVRFIFQKFIMNLSELITLSYGEVLTLK